MMPEKNLATVIDLDEARKKRARAARQSNFAFKPIRSASSSGSVPVTLINGTVIRVDAEDLSLEGVKLRTTEADARALYAPGQLVSEENPRIEIKIDLPAPEGHVPLLASCRLTHLEMLSPEDVTFTLEFLAFVGAGGAVLRHFLRMRASQHAAHKLNDAAVHASGKRRGS